MTTRVSWQDEGLCHRDRNPQLWDRFFADTALERREARNLCFKCPVREECLRTALESKNIWGVWGGCDEAELRRALWVNANGDPLQRCRYPHCPMCRARPSKLFVVGVCELPAGRRRENVECEMCGFTWRAASSVQAVKAYWREKAKLQRQAIRATAPRGRLPRIATVTPLRAPDPVTTVAAAIAASGARIQRPG